MIFRQFCAEDKQLSYLFADPITRHATVLDPHIQLEQDYLSMIHRLDLKLEFAVESHAHESHMSAAPVLCNETGAQWITSTRIDTGGAARTVDDGECLYIGEECFGALETPGHSSCSMCFRWRDRVFTGHTLLAGATGPCSRPDSDAGQLYSSITKRLYALPQDTLVYPGCECMNQRESTIRRERHQNRELNAHTTCDAFINCKRPELQAMPWASRRRAASDRRADLYPFR